MIEKDYAYAKINLSLDIISKMDNGYHNLKSIMQSISLCDEITIERTANNNRLGNDIYVKNPGRSYLPNDERNIAYKAAKAFLDYNNLSGNKVEISIVKNIPVCAGLGGGSTDGAAVLRIMDKMFDTKQSRCELIQLGNKVGSDVPFCIFGGTALAEGRGDILTDLTPLPACFFAICKPNFGCSTPELFKRINLKTMKIRPDTNGILSSLEDCNLDGVTRRMHNVFEDFLPNGKSDIEEIKSVLLDNGAMGSVMTGSGPAVFGIFDNEIKAKSAIDALSLSYEECFIATPIKH